MKKFTVILLLCLIAIVSLNCSGCGKGGETTPPTNNNQGETTTTGGESLLIPADKARDAGDWELPIVANPGDFGIQDKVKLSELLANPDVKAVVIDFWATWCEPCKEEMPYLEKVYKEYKDKGLAMLVITVDSSPQLEGDIKKDVEKLGVTYPIPWDMESKVKSFYGIGAIPVTYLIDKNGKIRVEHSGFSLPEGEEFIEGLKEAFEELISE
ncbi:MAG TPA: TlpA disulfide reductase family protein [Caldisericia bacterium]|nr:TlpA disulfide reductase family protein [Caldisericia bacterium]